MPADKPIRKTTTGRKQPQNQEPEQQETKQETKKEKGARIEFYVPEESAAYQAASDLSEHVLYKPINAIIRDFFLEDFLHYAETKKPGAPSQPQVSGNDFLQQLLAQLLLNQQQQGAVPGNSMPAPPVTSEQDLQHEVKQEKFTIDQQDEKIKQAKKRGLAGLDY
jgi:hypothetical protein